MICHNIQVGVNAISEKITGMMGKGNFQIDASKFLCSYEVKVIQDKKSSNPNSIQIRQCPTFDGCADVSGGYVIRTSHTDWGCKKVA